MVHANPSLLCVIMTDVSSVCLSSPWPVCPPWLPHKSWWFPGQCRWLPPSQPLTYNTYTHTHKNILGFFIIRYIYRWNSQVCVTEAIIKMQLKARIDPNVTPKVKYWYSRIVPPGQSSESILLEATPACLWTHDNTQFTLLLPNVNFWQTG